MRSIVSAVVVYAKQKLAKYIAKEQQPFASEAVIC